MEKIFVEIKETSDIEYIKRNFSIKCPACEKNMNISSILPMSEYLWIKFKSENSSERIESKMPPFLKKNKKEIDELYNKKKPMPSSTLPPTDMTLAWEFICFAHGRNELNYKYKIETRCLNENCGFDLASFSWEKEKIEQKFGFFGKKE